MEVLQHITNSIPITYKFLVITKTYLFWGFPLYPIIGDWILVIYWNNHYLKAKVAIGNGEREREREYLRYEVWVIC